MPKHYNFTDTKVQTKGLKIEKKNQLLTWSKQEIQIYGWIQTSRKSRLVWEQGSLGQRCMDEQNINTICGWGFSHELVIQEKKKYIYIKKNLI